LPPVGTSRNIAAIFKQYEEADQSTFNPAKRETYSDFSAKSVSNAHIVSNDVDVIKSGSVIDNQDELPPAQFTKNMLAKFKSLEDPSVPAPTPENTKHVSSHNKKENERSSAIIISENIETERQIYIETSDRADGEQSENQPVVLEGVVRESDTNLEEELPERGTTRSLLAQWRNMEQTVKDLEPPSPARASSNTLASNKHNSPAGSYNRIAPLADNNSYNGAINSNEETKSIEDELPPPAFTRNMLNKFQSMQAEADLETGSQKMKKQFRWSVKEVKPLFLGQSENNTAVESYPSGAIVPDNEADYSSDDDEQKFAPSNGSEHDEEMPPPELTKNLLAVFQSMEDVNLPPPTPEHARKHAKELLHTEHHYVESSEQSQDFDLIAEPINGHHDVDDDISSDQVFESRYSSDLKDSHSYEELNIEDELPEQGTTKNLMAKFQALAAV